MEHPVIIDSMGRASAAKYNLSRLANSHLISQYISSPQGRSALAQAMAAPLRRNLNYHGIARRVLNVSPLPTGALSYYERNIDVASVIVKEEKKPEYKHDKILVSSQGKIYTKGTFPSFRRVHFPLFEIATNSTIRLNEIKSRRYDLYERSRKDRK